MMTVSPLGTNSCGQPPQSRRFRGRCPRVFGGGFRGQPACSPGWPPPTSSLRHLAFARAVLPERWAHASRWRRFRVRWHAPLIVEVMFNMLVHPGVYEPVGLPGWRTWWAAKNSEARLELRYRATRPIAEALVGRAPSREGASRTCGGASRGHRPSRTPAPLAGAAGPDVVAELARDTMAPR